MTEDTARGVDAASVKALVPTPPERGTWHTIYRIDKYNDGREPDGNPDEVLEGEGNLLTDLGVRDMLNLLARNAGANFSTGVNAHVQAGSSNAPAVAADNVLTTPYAPRQVATAVVTNQSVAFSASFAGGAATGAWNEVGVFNSLAAGSMLNHLVTPLGTKGATSVWVLTITITIS